MHRLLLGFLIVGAAGMTATPALGQKGKRGESKSGWFYSLAEGKAKARETGKPLMVVLRCVP
jgi:hypothetical protein